MKRRASPRRTQCTLQQFLTGCDARFAYTRGVFLLLLVLLPQSTLAVWRACLFESKADTSGAVVRCVAGLSPAGRVPLCAGESLCVDSIPPLARGALRAALCGTNSFFCGLLTKAETSSARRGNCLLGENQEKRKVSPCGLGGNKAGSGSPASLSSKVNTGTPLSPPRLGSLRCPSCSSQSSSHASIRCTVPLNKCRSRSLFCSRVSLSVTQLFSTAQKTARLTLAVKHQAQYRAVRGLPQQSSLAPPVSFVQHFSCGWSPFCLRASKWSRFFPVVNPHEHGVVKHVPDNFTHRRIHNLRLQNCPSLARCCETGKTTGCCLLLGRRCSAWWAQFSIHSGRRRYGENAAQGVGCSLLQCPPRHNHLVIRSQQAHPANGFRCASIGILQSGRRARIQGAAKTKCLTATKRYANEFQTDWKDAAAVHDAEQREQEAFEKMASQVESHLRFGTDVCTAVARNLLDGQSLMQHDCQRAALQQPDQHGHQANPARPTANYRQRGSKTRESEQHQACRNGECLADQHEAEETADEQRRRRYASTVLKGYRHADGVLRPTQVSASLRTGAVISPQTSITDRDYGKEAATETPAPMASLTLPERLHENELSHSEKGCSSRVSSPSRSSGLERQPGVTGRHTFVYRKLVGVQLKGKQREQIDGTQPQQGLLQKPVQNEQEQRRQAMVGVPVGRQDGGPHSIIAARDQKVRMSARAGRLSHGDSDRLDDSVNGGETGDGDEGRRRDRRLIHLLLQSQSVSDVWRVLHPRNVQLLSGAGLVGVIQRLASLCVAAQRQTEKPHGKADATLEPRSGRVDGVDASLCGNQRNTSPYDISAGVHNSIKLKVRAELKKHPIFKDIMNALPAKVDSLRTSEAAALLHALATLRIRSAPDLLQRTGAVIAAKAFCTGSVEHASVKPTPLPEHLKDVTLGRLWASVEILPALQHHPLRDALTCYTIRRLKNAPERTASDQESAVAIKESRPEVVDLQEDCNDSRAQLPSKDAGYHNTAPIPAVTAAVIAKAAVQMRVGSQAPDFVRALQLYVLRLLLDSGSKAPDGTVGTEGKLGSKHTEGGARSSVIVRLVSSLAILKSQQQETPDSRGSVAPETSQVSPGFATGRVDEQIAFPTERRATRLCRNVNESPHTSGALYSSDTTAWSDATETGVEEEDGVFLKALGAYFRSRMATLEPTRDELSRLLKALNYFYRSALWKLQLQMHTKAGPSSGCGILRSCVTLLPSLVVAAAVVIKQKEGSLDNPVGLADLLINLNSLLQTSKTLLKVTDSSGTTHGAASPDHMYGIGELLAGAEEDACLAQKLQENEWRRGEEFVKSVLRRMAERLHHQLGSILQKLRERKEAQDHLESRERPLSGTMCFEDVSLAPTHLGLLDKSKELLEVLLQLNCTYTGDRLVECVRMLIDFCSTSPSRSGDCLVFKEVEDDSGALGEKAPSPAAAHDNKESISKSQSTVGGIRGSSSSASFRQCATQTIHSSEEERLHWRRQLLDGSLLLRLRVRRTNCSIRRAVWAADTVDELLSAVMSGLEHRQHSAPRWQTTGAAARAAEKGYQAPSSGDFQNVLKASSDDAGAGLLEKSLDDLTMTSALHRLAVLQQRHHDDCGMSGTQSSVSQMEAGKRDGNSILHDPRMHLLLQAVAAKIPTMGPQVTRILWALGKLRYFEQRDILDSETEFDGLLQQSSLRGRSRPGLAGPEDAGIEDAATTPPAFSALRKNITLLLLQRLAELIRAECLSDSELSATLHVLSGKSFSATVPATGLPNSNTSPWAQAVDRALQNIRRWVSSTLLRSAHSLSGLDASVALYSLATLGWTASAPHPLLSLTREPFKTISAPSESGGAQKKATPEQTSLGGVDLFEQHKAYDSTRVTSNSPSPREFWENVQALPDEENTDSSGDASKNDALNDRESLTYSALLQRLTEEMDNCNVQTLVVALWAVAITAGQRQPVSQRQTTDMNERKQEHETVSEMTFVETRTLSSCIQNGTFGPHEHEVEEPLLYEKPVWLSPVETTFLAAVRDKLKKQVAEMGRAPLSMLLLSALMLRWQQPTLLLKTIRRTLDTLRMGSIATTAENAACSVDGKRLKSRRTDAFPFRESRGLQKTGELHSRVWAILAMLQQQQLFSVTREIDTSDKSIRFKHEQHSGKQPEQAPSQSIDLRSVKRLAAVQLKEDLKKALCTSVRSCRPQREWTLQHVQSLLLSCTIMEEDRMQHQQQLEVYQNMAGVADPPASSLLGADDTVREVFFLLERLTSSLLWNAAAHSGAAVELGPQPEKGAIQQKQSAAQSEAQTLPVTEPPAARVRSKQADTGCEAVGPELMHQQLKVTQWVKRLSLLLFALRRLRQLFFENSAQSSRLREANAIPNPGEETQLTEAATLPPPTGSKQQPEKDFSHTKARQILGQSSVRCPLHRMKLLEGVAQLITALLRCEALRPSHPQLPSLLIEFHRLLEDSEYSFAAEESGQSRIFSFAAGPSRPSAENDSMKEEHITSAGHTWQEGTHESVALNEAVRKLGEALSDWVCLHLGETDDRMYNVLLPLVRMLGAEAHLLSALHRIALQPIKQKNQTHVSVSDVRRAPYVTDMPSQMRDFGTNSQECSTRLRPSDRWVTKVLPFKADFPHSQQLPLRRSRAASLALMLHHRHRIAFHPPSMHMSLVQSATEPAELLATFPSDAAHALSALQRWKSALERAETEDYPEVLDLQLSNNVFGGSPSAGPRGQESCSTHLGPSGSVSALKTLAPHELLRSRVQVLVSGLSQPRSPRKDALHSRNASVSTTDTGGARQSMKDTSGFGPDKPSRAHEQVVSPPPELPTAKSHENQSPERCCDSGLTQWDMLPLQQLVHASTAAAQLLELPSADPVWKRAYLTSNTMDSGTRGATFSRIPYVFAKTGCKAVKFSSESCSDSPYKEAGKRPSLYSYGLAPAAAALTRYLLQQRASTAYSGRLPVSSTLSGGTESTYASGFGQFVEQQTVTTGGLSHLKANAGNQLPMCNVSCCVSTHASSAKPYLAESARSSIQTRKHEQNAGDCGGGHMVKWCSGVTASSRSWKRLRLFVKARRDWLAAAGALRLLGGGENSEDVTQTLAAIACEIADLLEGYTYRVQERVALQQNAKEQDRTHSVVYSDEDLELVDVEKQPSLDDVFFEEEENICAATGQPAVGCMASSAKTLHQTNPGTTLEKQQLVLVQQLACSCFEEISHQLKALHTRSCISRRTEDSPAKAHCEKAAQAVSVSGARLLGALASAPILPVNAAAFLLQPSLGILETGVDEHVAGNQQATLLHSPQKGTHAKASSVAEVYTIHLTTLIRRLLPLAPQWAPRLGSHRAAALFLEAAENVECARLCELQQLADGGTDPASGLLCSESAPADAAANLSDRLKRERRQDQNPSLANEEKLHEDDGGTWLARSFMRAKRSSGRLQGMLLELQKTVLSHAQCSPGRMARFWRALTLQAESEAFQSRRLAVASEEARSQAAKSTINRGAHDEREVSRCGQQLEKRIVACRAVFTTVTRFLDELTASAVLASQADLPKRLHGNAAAHSGAGHCPTAGITAATSRTAGGHKVSIHSNSAGVLFSCTASTQGANSVDWTYGAVAAAGSGLLGDSAQQRVATAAAQVSDGTATYFGLLSFLANSRDAPVDAIASLVQMLASAARDHLSAIRAADVVHPSPRPAQVKYRIREQDNEQQTLKPEGTVTETDHLVEGSGSEKVTAFSLYDAHSNSTRLVRLARAAWLMWIAASLQQHKQGECLSALRRGHVCWETLDVPKPVDEKDTHSMRAAKQAVEETTSAIVDLLQEEIPRQTNEFGYPRHTKRPSTDQSFAAATTTEVYRLLILSLDTVVKMYPENSEHGGSRRLSRIEVILSALTSLIEGAIRRTLQAPSTYSFSQRAALSFLSHPSLPSMAYILHLARQARVYYPPLLHAISGSIRWHRHKASSREEEPAVRDDTSKRSGLHEAPNRLDGGCCSVTTRVGCDVDLWPSLLLLADAATYQPQEGLKGLKQELLLFVERLVEGAPLSHVVRILRFSMNATPIRDVLPSRQPERGGLSNRVTPGKSTADVSGTKQSFTKLQAAQELKMRRVYDNIVHRCMTEGASLLLKLRPNGKDWSGTLEEQLAKLEADGYAPVGLIDTLNKIHLLHSLSETKTGGTIAAEEGKQGIGYELLPGHVRSDSLDPSLELETHKRTTAKGSRRNANFFSVPSENRGWWSQILRWIVKYYIGKRSSGLHKAVSGVLSHTLRLPHQDEVWTATGLSLDIVLDQRAVDGKPIAVEVDGPTHYVTALESSPAAARGYQGSAGDPGNVQLSPPRRRQLATALTQFKRQLLEQTGWHVVSIPFFEWKLPSRTRPLTPDSERRKTANLKKQSIDQLASATLGRRNDTRPVFAAEEQHSVLLVAAKLRPLLSNPPFDMTISETKESS